MRVQWIVIPVALAAAGLMASGYLMGRTSSEVRSSPKSDSPQLAELLARQQESINRLTRQIATQRAGPVQSAGAVEPDPQALKTAVRAALDEREEDNAAAKVAAETPSPESLAVYAQGQQTIKNAIASGRWTHDDDAALSKLSADLTREQARALRKEMIRAYNDQKINVVR